MPDPVVLTGASGFIAKHIARQLLEEGHAVRATLRSLGRAEEVRAAVLPGLPEDAARRLTFAEADLTSDRGWAQALSGATALLHTASPFPTAQPRDPQEIIRPAVEGTRRALLAAADAGVTRVVLTSSVAAIAHPGPPEVKDESDWLDPHAPGTTAYDASKALAERAAWEIAGARGLRLTAINPSLVLGPLLDRQSGTSVGIVRRLLAGKDPAIPRLNVSAVDVRDVARLHVLALSTPESEGERVIASAGLLPMPEMARALSRAFPDRRIPTRVAPDWLLRALALVMAELRDVTPHLGRRDVVSNAKATRLFGLRFIPPEDALLASAQSLIEKGLA
jgi:dihydroflavonol-4-reductase